MEIIKLLPEQEILKIAAGQVVDRPANVIKELMENSVDAEATNITVYIQNGGKDLMRVVDNGCGMSPKDAKFSFKKHATSKIRNLQDLDSINTFGFRGEALASISAISKVILTTKDKISENGIKLELENNLFISDTQVPFSQGTDLEIKELFYNTPARQKFLKKRETENRHITQLFQSFCLNYLNITFKLSIDGKQTINCPTTDCIIKRASQIWGHNFAQNIIPLKTTVTNKISPDNKKPVISGAITNHQYFRYDRGNIFLFVNNRWVKNHEIQSGLLKGYLNVLPPARYPAAFIFLQIDPSLIDVNIHPRKEEVKFLHPRIVTTTLQSLVKKALEDNLSKQINQDVTFKQEHTPQKTPNYLNPQKDFNNNFTPKNFTNPEKAIFPSAPFAQQKSNTENFKPFNFDPFLQEKKFTPEAQIPKEINQTIIKTPNKQSEQKSQTNLVKHDYEIIGQFKRTYILIEKPDGLFFVDQHVAHERVLYQLFSKRFKDIATVKLLFPQLIALKEDDITLLEPHINIFKKNGIDIEIFGQNQIKIQATPVHIKDVNLQDLISEIISSIKEHQTLDTDELFKKINDELQAQMACKAAIKGGDILTMEQMKQLLDDLNKTESRFACPHGRPTGWMLTTYEIEKKFKRKV